ncbi:MAG: hypothetical protein IT294_12500 [Deltaproteobacteria bacterium]|nr:hypothetical protein [Deltaproteobacteria bacterium]
MRSCANGFQDGSETDVDCGGGSCRQCPLGGGCATGGDCVNTTVCIGSQCTCAAGQSDCNVIPGDGCEVDTLIDPNNCGACASVCPNPLTCVNAICQ